MTNATTIVFHLGAPKLNMDMLTWSLRKDNALLGEHRVMARRPRFYRGKIHDRLMEMAIEGQPAGDTNQFLNKLCQGPDLERLLLSDGNLLAPLEKVFSPKGLYADTIDHIAQLVALFPDNPCEFFLETRNPTEFAGEVAELLDDEEPQDLLNGSSAENLNWFGVVEDIKKAAPDSPVTVWRHEDCPVVWPEVLRAVSGIEADVNMDGDLDQAVLILPAHAGERLGAFLEARPELTLKQRRHVITSFLQTAVPKRGQPSMTYDADTSRIHDIPGVTVID